MTATPWLIVPNPVMRPDLRLFCFPHAGGGATFFQNWAEGVHPTVEVCAVQLPGRETRLAEPPMTNVEAVAALLVSELLPRPDAPSAFYGHSMGALVAFETARQLRRRGGRQPVHLFVSGRPAPHIFHRDQCIRTLPDAEFVREVAFRYNGIPDAIFREPELLRLITPLLRADIAMVETYHFAAEPALEVPISAFSGMEDPSVEFEEIESWREHTRAAFRLELIPGGHFFPQTNRGMLLASIMRDLAGVLKPMAGAVGA